MDITSQLEFTQDQTLRYFDLNAIDLDRRYADDKWSVRFILHHLPDAEAVLSERIRQTISESRPVLWAFNQDAWATALDYSQFDS